MKFIASLLLLAIVIGSLLPTPVRAQSNELVQLILNVEKLKQFRDILDNMKEGYKTLSKGYNLVNDLSKGNFDLHKLFLDGLMEVSPTVRKYKKIATIISHQRSMVKEYTEAFQGFKSKQVFSAEDMSRLESTYKNIIKASTDDLAELLTIITAGELRMNDAERILAIDRIDIQVADKLNVVRQLNKSTFILQLQREKAKRELNTLRQLYGAEK